MEIVVTRKIDAPVGQVWRAWTDPELIKRWWGPTGFTAPLAKVDFREGGTTLVCMRTPDGQVDLYNIWTYTRIVPHERIEFVMNFADDTGKRIAPADAGLPPTIPQDVRHVVTFAPTDEGTTMTVTEYGYQPGSEYETSKLGQEQVCDKLAAIFNPGT